MSALSLTQFCLPRYLGSGFGPCSAVYVVKDMFAGFAPRHQLAVCVVVLSDVCVERSPRLWHSDEARHRPPAVHPLVCVVFVSFVCGAPCASKLLVCMCVFVFSLVPFLMDL